MLLPSDILMLEAWQESEGALKIGYADNAPTKAAARKMRIIQTPLAKIHPDYEGKGN